MAASGFPVASQAQSLAPTIDHTPPDRLTRGEPASLPARIVSLSKKPVFDPVAYVRPPGFDAYLRVPMRADPGRPGHYIVDLAATAISGDFDYFLEAFDEDGNGPGRAGSPEAPFHVVTVARTATADTAPSGPSAPADPWKPATVAADDLAAEATAPRPDTGRLDRRIFLGIGADGHVGLQGMVFFGGAGYQVTPALSVHLQVLVGNAVGARLFARVGRDLGPMRLHLDLGPVGFVPQRLAWGGYVAPGVQVDVGDRIAVSLNLPVEYFAALPDGYDRLQVWLGMSVAVRI